MEHCKIIAVGDNVCDKYLSRGKMYPGGQCVNTCVYVKMNNMESAYLGKYGDDEVAACVQDTLKEIGIDDSHCRRYEGENGFALVTLKETDRATYQAMEALIHNLNTMNSRAGAQTPFSSINYGTDTSIEGRLVIKNILLAEEAGLGNGETPIFPIHIFR